MMSEEDDMTTWRILIGRALKDCDETWSDIIKCTLTQKELDVEFDSGYGCHEGKPFLAWSFRHVYFAACYDGSEWVASVPAHPYPGYVIPDHTGGG